MLFRTRKYNQKACLGRNERWHTCIWNNTRLPASIFRPGHVYAIGAQCTIEGLLALCKRWTSKLGNSMHDLAVTDKGQLFLHRNGYYRDKNTIWKLFVANCKKNRKRCTDMIAGYFFCAEGITWRWIRNIYSRISWIWSTRLLDLSQKKEIL